MKLRLSAGPSLRVLLALAGGVLLVHGLLLLGAASPLSLRLPAAAPPPVQVRVVTPAIEAVRAPAPRVRPVARAVTRAVPPVALGSEATEVVAEGTPGPSTLASEPVAVAHTEAASAPQVPPVHEAVSDAPTHEAGTPHAQPNLGTLPLISLGALPPSRLLSYQLTGMEKGLTYHATGELRWQHNDTAYELALSVRAFLVGSRHWRSVGQIDATGLVPRRFSDSWRNERAAHFDPEQQRIVFSSNSTPAPWQPGAQDQVSLYVQLAAAMAGEPERFVPGTRLQVQTATVRDALPWTLVLESAESLTVDGQSVRTLKWVAQPRQRYDTRVEFWVAPLQAWLPVRIRITQVSGSYIDLAWRGTEPLPPLPPTSAMASGEKRP